MAVERIVQLVLDNVLIVESDSENDTCESYCKRVKNIYIYIIFF